MSLSTDIIQLSQGEFRESDGTGNNLANDSWGSTGETLVRVTFADYADAISEPEDRGNARVISNAMADIPDGTPNSLNSSQLFIFIGQFLDHDIDLVFEDEAAGDMSTIVPANDPAFPEGSELGLTRSKVVPGTGENGLPREHANEITSYIDSSNVYGSTQATTDVLRDGAYLITNADGGVPNIADIEAVHGAGAADGLWMGNPATAHVIGDVRGDENLALTSMHEIWLKEHNYQVDRLKDMNLGLTDEQLFQTARMIVGAEWQKVIFEEWLPELIGNVLPAYTGYKSDVNATISNEFAGAAFRFGHTMLPTDFERLAEDGTTSEQLGLFDAFFQPHKLDQGGGVAALVRGLSADVTSEFDAKIIDDVRNLLFGGPRDLASLNIMRGRDQGVPTLNQVRADLDHSPALQPYTSFAELTSDADLANALSQAYGGDIDKVDLWVGVLAEDKIPGGQVGETLQAILIDQFSRLRDGDRFYYEHKLADAPDLLQEIQDTSFSEIIKRTTGIEHLQHNVFKAYDRLVGDEFDNSIVGTVAKELIVGEEGNDTLLGGMGTDEMHGDHGEDLINGGGDSDTIHGGFGSDTIYGGDGDDTAYGEQGWDKIVGGRDSDTLYGGTGNDSLYGQHGQDWMYGGDHNDRLLGADGNDRMYGENGADQLFGGRHNDHLYGGNGNDRLFGQQGADMINGGSGNDHLNGGSNQDWMFGGDQNDLLIGSDGNDRMYGEDGADRLYGGRHNDHLFGGDGNDRIYGQHGADRIDGGSGNDHLNGGTGADLFIMGDNMDVDRIHGFEVNRDKLNVSAHYDSVQEVFQNAYNTAYGSVISFGGGDKAILIGISLDDLNASNFSFNDL